MSMPEMPDGQPSSHAPRHEERMRPHMPLHHDQRAAELTLGRPLINPHLFGRNCRLLGLGHALNVEQELLP